MADIPNGTITFLFTDIEGSTALWEQHPAAMKEALARHDELLQEAVQARGGYVFKKVGDGHCVAFSTAPAALLAAAEGQRALCMEDWGQTPIRVRMALHTGTAQLRDGDYLGPPLNRVSRLLSAGHGGQVLLSHPVQELVRDDLPPGVVLRRLGEHRLKDLIRPERVYQLVAPGLPSSFPPLTSLETRPNNLPPQPTPLIGREREVVEICRLLRLPEIRLLTFTGPGGTGKTRLGLQTAAELLEEFEDGVYFVPLAAISDPALVSAGIAQALGLRETAEQSLHESLRASVASSNLLIILDNFEQVTNAAPLVADLLAAAPQLKLLVTSRSVLHLSLEHEYRVQPLGLPDPRKPLPLDDIVRYASVRLFGERARAAKPEFTITSENAPTIAEICRRLDGLPLAIELAAARVRFLSPQAMLARLDSRLRLLTGGPQDLPARQRTLRGTIDWSYGLLDEREQCLFARLSVFSGGCTLDAAESVCDAAGDLGVDVLEGLSSLVDKSLLRSGEGPEGESRFLMLETIREYARERLASSGEEEELLHLHAHHFLALAETAEPELTGRKQALWLNRLETEHDNLRGALAWSLDQPEAEVGLRLASALWRLWYNRGYLSEGRRWLEAALARDAARGSPAPPLVRAKALQGAGMLAWDQGSYARARELLEESLSVRREFGDNLGVARSLNALGLVALYRAEYEESTRLFEQSLDLNTELNDTWGRAMALGNLGLAAIFRGEFLKATALLEQSLALKRELGIEPSIAESLNNLGLAAMYVGDHDEAQRRHEESLSLKREHGNKEGIATSVHNLGLVALDRGDIIEAGALLRDALKRFRDLGDSQGVVEALEALACLAAAWRQPVRAARLWSAAVSGRLLIGAPIPPAEREFFSKWISTVPEAEMARARDRAMSLDEATAYAMEDAPGDDVQR